MSDTNYTLVGITEEVIPGTTPTTPAFEKLRITSSSLGAAPKTVESDEITGDPNVTDAPLVGLEPGGDLGILAVYDAIATPAEGLMRNRWVNTPVRYNNGTADSIITDVTATDITVLASNGTRYRMGTFAPGHLIRTSGFTNSGNNGLRKAAAGTTDTDLKLSGGTIEAAPPGTARAKVVGFEGASGDINATSTGLASSSLDFTTLGLLPGQWLKVGGSAAGEKFGNVPANNTFVRVHPTTPITANALPLDNLPAGWGVDNGSGKTIRVWMSDRVTNGTSKIFYSLEQQYSDLTVPEYEYYSGARVNTLDVRVPKKDKLTMSMNFVAMNFPGGVTSRFAGASDVAAPTGDVMNTASNVARISENGAALGGVNVVTGFTMQFNNNLRRRDGVGEIGSFGFGDAKLRVTGSLETYYGSKAIRDKIINNTATALNTVFTDPTATKAIVFDLPRAKFTAGDPQNGGVDQDRMFNPTFLALKHASLGYTASISRFEEYAS